MSQQGDVERFVRAQDGGEYERALAEIRAGRKESHWIWYVFPQVRGLGYSEMAQYYGIASHAELEAFVAHPALMARLREITKALLELPTNDPEEVLGWIDALKVRSCMTLFADETNDPLFANVLAKYYAGEPDEATRAIVAGWEG